MISIGMALGFMPYKDTTILYICAARQENGQAPTPELVHSTILLFNHTNKQYYR